MILFQTSGTLRSEIGALRAQRRALVSQRRELASHIREESRPYIQASLRRIIRWKLLAGRLPRDSASILSGRPGTGERCVACDLPLDSTQLVMEVPWGDAPVHFHANCFMLWDDERRKPDTQR